MSPICFIYCIFIEFYVFLKFSFETFSLIHLAVLKFYFQVYIDFPVAFLLISSLIPLQLENIFCVVSRIMSPTKMLYLPLTSVTQLVGC